MSYYYGHGQQHPFFQSPTPVRHPHPQFNLFNAAPPPHHFGPRHPYHIYNQHPFVTIANNDELFASSPRARAQAQAEASPSQPASSTLDEEERAALAHLRSIQRRKEAEQESIRREAAARLQAKQEREAAVRRAIEAEKEREEAIARLVKQKEDEQRRRAAIRSALEEKRAADIQNRREYIQAIQQAKQEYYQQVMARKAECAKRYAAKHAARASRQFATQAQRDYKNEFEQLNQVLGGLFGINLAPADQTDGKEDVTDNKDVVQEKTDEIKENKKEVHFDEKATKNSSTTAEKSTDSPFPKDVNDLLHQFLGLRVEPTTDNAVQGDNKVPEGLNQFLSQFGLVFEPLESEEQAAAGPSNINADKEVKSTPKEYTTVAKPSNDVVSADPEVPSLPPVNSKTAPSAPASASQSNVSAPKVDDAPLTAFLNIFTDLPPFVRDILGNVEIAFKEELNKGNKEKEEVVEGKGKGVAQGEKNPSQPSAPSLPVVSSNTPSESVDTASSKDSITSLNKLNNISHELTLVKDSFEFPEQLSFGPTPSSTSDQAPNLLFNKVNHKYHAQANKLLQLLLEADGVDSGGDKQVRKLRKDIVQSVENEIENLEKKRDVIWRDVRDKREKGEYVQADDIVESESITSGSGNHSSSSSVIDAADNYVLDHILEDGDHHDHVEGFEVSGSNNEETQPDLIFDAPADDVPEAKEEKEEAVEVGETVDQSEEAEKKEDVKAAPVQDQKEEEYELL